MRVKPLSTEQQRTLRLLVDKWIDDRDLRLDPTMREIVLDFARYQATLLVNNLEAEGFVFRDR